MKIFAKVKDYKVVKVIVADDDFFDTFVDDSSGRWIETKEDGSIRKYYAGVGYNYNFQKDIFYPPKRYDSWVLNEDTYNYEPPIERPLDGKYDWDEANKNWIKLNDE